MQIIPPIHTSEATAFLILDYPYGRTLRCQKRVWLEVHPKRGTRLVSRTSNPKRGNDWNNAAKASTYSEISGALYLDENNYVQWATLGQYADAKEARAYLDTYGAGATNLPEVKRWVQLKERFELELNERNRPSYGTPEFQAAYKAAILWSRANPIV